MKRNFADRFINGIEWLAAIFVGLVALNIIRIGGQVIRESVGGLMDAAPATPRSSSSISPSTGA